MRKTCISLYYMCVDAHTINFTQNITLQERHSEMIEILNSFPSIYWAREHKELCDI